MYLIQLIHCLIIELYTITNINSYIQLRILIVIYHKKIIIKIISTDLHLWIFHLDLLKQFIDVHTAIQEEGLYVEYMHIIVEKDR